jgi:hypothetical protein
MKIQFLFSVPFTWSKRYFKIRWYQFIDETVIFHAIYPLNRIIDFRPASDYNTTLKPGRPLVKFPPSLALSF